VSDDKIVSLIIIRNTRGEWSGIQG
jgi:hypothetical protein